MNQLDHKYSKVSARFSWPSYRTYEFSTIDTISNNLHISYLELAIALNEERKIQNENQAKGYEPTPSQKYSLKITPVCEINSYEPKYNNVTAFFFGGFKFNVQAQVNIHIMPQQSHG